MAQTVTLTGRKLTIGEVANIARGARVSLSADALSRVARSRKTLDRVATERIIYGVNTGFGPMASKLVGKNDLAELQRNLVRSHACGAGEAHPERYVAAAMAVRLNTLLRGDSGVSRELLERLRDYLNARIFPIVPEHGGVGASGDLIELAHIALGLIGEGEVMYRGERMEAKTALIRAKLSLAYTLKSKEGLALMNGTSCMAGISCLVLEEATNLFSEALRSSALALEVAGAFSDSIDPFIESARPHPGQKRVGELLRELTKGSRLLRSREEFERLRKPDSAVRTIPRAQDVYSLRCTPQLMGPMLETLARARKTLAIEINAATDNPLVSRDGRVLHGGNFHGEYVAEAMDMLKISLAKLSMLSERRLNFFLNEKVNGRFAPFLNKKTPGLTLGLQGLQFTATSTVAENQSLAYPHSLHSIPSNADNQDVVSMGTGAALLAARVVHNASIVLAAERVALSQAFALSGEERRASPSARQLLKKTRSVARPVEEDRPLYKELETLAGKIRGEGSLLDLEF